ncbi:MAG TPA: hypothetical protein VIQ22_04340 [Gammaproteobacteria bacterium]
MSDAMRPIPLLLSAALAMSAATAPLHAAELADPMRPPAMAADIVDKKKGVQHYQLSSIYISPQHRSAIINGRRVGIGDWVANARVVDIRGDAVTLSIAGKTRTLTLLPISIKKPVEASRQ